MGSFFSRRSEQKTIIVAPAVTTIKPVDQDVSEPTGTVEYVNPVAIGEKGTVDHVIQVATGPTGTVEHVEHVVLGPTGTVEHVMTIVSGYTGTVEPIKKEDNLQSFITPLTQMVEVENPSDENVVSAKRHKKNHKKN